MYEVDLNERRANKGNRRNFEHLYATPAKLKRKMLDFFFQE